MESLPVEIISHILCFLNIPDQLRSARVNRRWRVAVEHCLRGRRSLVPEDLPRRWTGEMMCALLPRLPSLRVLLFTHGDIRIDLHFIVEHCPRLEELDLLPFRLTNDTVDMVCRSFPRVTALQLPEFHDDATLAHLLRRLPGLRQLSLGEFNMSMETVALLPSCLQSLDIGCCCLPANLPDQPADRWPEMKELYVGYAEDATCRKLPSLMAGCPNVERLTVRVSEAKDDVLHKLSTFAQLQYLDLSYCDVLTEDGLAGCLVHLKRLETLDLGSVRNVTDKVLNLLAGLEVLSLLILGASPFPRRFSINAVERLVLVRTSLKCLRFDQWRDSEPLEDLQMLVGGLARQLSPERQVTLAMPESFLVNIDQSVLSSCERPLRLTASNEHRFYW